MGHSVSSWFMQQLENKYSEPKRFFYMAGSDHSSKVLSWPKIRRTSLDIAQTTMTIKLINLDGNYNDFYTDLFTLNASCYIGFGFNHPTSGDEMIRIASGKVKKAKFNGYESIQLTVYDKMNELSKKVVGESDATVTFSHEIPSDIAWTLCTSYGQLSSTQSSANTDINWPLFQSWAASFSADSILCSANYDGQKVVEALNNLIKYTDSLIWEDGLGRICFSRFTENSSDDFLILEGQNEGIDLNVDAEKIITKCKVGLNYLIASDKWDDTVTYVNTSSQNSWGNFTEKYRFEDIWFVNSAVALNLAQRITTRFAVPYKEFEIKVPVFGIHRTPSDAMRFISSFWGVNSANGWRIGQQQIDLKNLEVKWTTMPGYISTAFYLDISHLDGSEELL